MSKSLYINGKLVGLKARIVPIATEVVLIALASVSPWALGSRGSAAQLSLSCGVFLLAFLRVLECSSLAGVRCIVNMPSLGLLGLCLIAVLQATPCSEPILHRLSPPSAQLRADLVPSVPEKVAGDTGPPVPLPPATLSQYPEATRLMAARLAALWIVFQSVLSLGPGTAAYRRFASLIVANSFLLGFFSLVQHLAWNGKIYWFYPAFDSSAGPFWNHNALTATLNMGLGHLLGLIIYQRNETNRLHPIVAPSLYVYLLAVIVASVVASLSRVGFLSMMMITAVAIAMMLRRKYDARAIARLLGGTIAIVFALIVIVLGSIPIHQRLGSIFGSNAYMSRIQIWRAACRAWSSYPIWGTGLGTFPVATIQYVVDNTLWKQVGLEGNVQYAGTVYTHAENEYLEWLVEGGLIGLVSYLAVPVGTAWAIRSLLKRPDNTEVRSLIIGSLLAGLSLMVHSFSDFALHTPPVALTAVILVAFICKARLESEPRGGRLASLRLTGAGSFAFALLLLCASGMIVAALYPPARAEWELAHVRLTEVDRIMDRVKGDVLPATDLENQGAAARVIALDAALRHRPDWAEGHLLLANSLVELYENQTASALDVDVEDAQLKRLYANPLWLHRLYHAAPRNQRKSIEEILEFEPVADCLVPATLEYIEARRCCPSLALPHVALASFDYLLLGGDSSEVYLDRAYRLAGSQSPVLELIAQVAVQSGDLELACRCWRSLLLSQPLQWPRYADAAGSLLSPEQVLESVAVNAKYARLFAERLYDKQEDALVRQRFFKEALRRLPSDDSLNEAEKLECASSCERGLGEEDRARQLLIRALQAESDRIEWRLKLVDWLIEDGKGQEARRQALIAVQLHPTDPLAQQAIRRAIDADLKGAK